MFCNATSALWTSDPDSLNERDWSNIWSAVKRKQSRIMADCSQLTKRQYFAESAAERQDYAKWLLAQ